MTHSNNEDMMMMMYESANEAAKYDAAAQKNNRRKYTRRLDEAPGKISYYKLRVPNAKIERVYKLGDTLSVTYNSPNRKADESWDIKLFRPSIRPDGAVRFRTALVVSTEHNNADKAEKVAQLISKEYGIPFSQGITNGTELELSHTKRTIRSVEEAKQSKAL